MTLVEIQAKYERRSRVYRNTIKEHPEEQPFLINAISEADAIVVDLKDLLAE